MEWALLPYKRYAEFHGRSRRLEYWFYGLMYLVVVMIIAIPLAIFGSGQEGFDATNPVEVICVILLAIWFFGNLIPGLALTVRRWHDLGQSGWFVLLFGVLGVIPIINILTVLANLIWFFIPGTQGENQYGPDPKA